MSSAFTEAWADACQDLNDEFAEQIEITPRRSAEGELKGRSPDPARDPRTVLGIFRAKPVDERLGGARRGTELQGMTSISGLTTRVWFSAEVLAELGYRPVRDDLLSLVDRPERPTYMVVKSGPNDHDDNTFPLVRAGRNEPR